MDAVGLGFTSKMAEITPDLWHRKRALARRVERKYEQNDNTLTLAYLTAVVPATELSDTYFWEGTGDHPAMPLKCTSKIANFQPQILLLFKPENWRPMHCQVVTHVHYHPGHSLHFLIHVLKK